MPHLVTDHIFQGNNQPFVAIFVGLFGELVLNSFGISLAALRTAGGVLLLLIAMAAAAAALFERLRLPVIAGFLVIGALVWRKRYRLSGLTKVVKER